MTTAISTVLVLDNKASDRPPKAGKHPKTVLTATALAYIVFIALVWSESRMPGYGYLSRYIRSPESVAASREVGTARAMFVANMQRFDRGYACPDAARWDTLPVAAQNAWHAHWTRLGAPTFERSTLCYAAQWDAVEGLMQSDPTFAPVARHFATIFCPIPARLAAFGELELARWHAFGKTLGPFVAGSGTCYDP